MKRFRLAVPTKKLLKVVKKLLKTAPEIVVYPGDKRVFFSDLHRSDGSKADESAFLTDILDRALGHYAKQRFGGIYLGDILELIEALWPMIIRSDPKGIILQLIALCLIYILGNHDRKANKIKHAVLAGIQFAPAVKLVSSTGKLIALCLHGDQADLCNKGGIQTVIVNWIVRYIWTALQKLGLKSEPKWPEASPAKNEDKATAIEKVIQEVARILGIVILVGHTHLPKIVYLDNNAAYINVGSGTQKGKISCVELMRKACNWPTTMIFRLVYWDEDRRSVRRTLVI